MGVTKPKEKEATMKGLMKVCSECDSKTELREIAIEFERKQVRATMSGIPAMVCPQCGQEYVPGDVAADVLETVSRTIDDMEALLKRSERRRRKLLPGQSVSSPGRLELALAS